MSVVGGKMNRHGFHLMSKAQAAALGITRCLCGCPVDKHLDFDNGHRRPCTACKCTNLKRYREPASQMPGDSQEKTK